MVFITREREVNKEVNRLYKYCEGLYITNLLSLEWFSMIISLICTKMIYLVSGYLYILEKPRHKRGWARFKLGTIEKSRDRPNILANQKARNKDLKYNR